MRTARRSRASSARSRLRTLRSVEAGVVGSAVRGVAIERHTDSTSTEQRNQDLSERRSRTVVANLTGAGIDASRLTAVGYGSSKRVASNDNATGRAQNRRVELALAGKS